MNRTDILILMHMVEADATNEVKSMSRDGLIEDLGYSKTRIRLFVEECLDENYIDEGLKNGRKKTYFVTQHGVDYLKEMTGGEENDPS